MTTAYSRLHWVVRVDFGLFIVRVDVETALSQCFLLGVAFFFKFFNFVYPQVFPVRAVFLSLKMASGLTLFTDEAKRQKIRARIMWGNEFAIPFNVDYKEEDVG